MNIYQKIVLIIGALVILTLFFFTYGGDKFHPFYAIVALVKGAGVIGATLLIFFALKGIKGKKDKES
jgi:hypothetical protein